MQLTIGLSLVLIAGVLQGTFILVMTLTREWRWEHTWAIFSLLGMLVFKAVTRDPVVCSEARKNLDYILQHPQADGSLGPNGIGPSNWPQAIVFRALMEQYHISLDRSILTQLRRHYLSRSANFGEGRDVCNIEEMLNIYGINGDKSLLTKALHTYTDFNREKSPTSLERLDDDSPIHEHGVTFNETAKLPALIYLRTGDQKMLSASLRAYLKLDRDHMLASGLHSAQETLDGNEPHLYHETCNVSDYTWSIGYLLMATGDATWADHIEKAVFNAGLGSITKDFKAHQYFSAPNQVVAAQGIQTIFDEYRVAYRPGHVTECCSGNVHRFLPNYVLRQWLITPHGGVVAALYGASRFTAYIRGIPVTFEQRTSYPFSETIEFVIHTPKPVTLPFYVRIPGWTASPTLTVNGKSWLGLCSPGSFESIHRRFEDGDVVTLEVPMPIHMRHWGKQAVSIERGPLVYSLKLEEDARPVQGFKTTPEFPAWDIRPASPWNYGLVLKNCDLLRQIQVSRRATSGCPWDIGNSPIELRIPAMRIDNWILPDRANPKLPQHVHTSGSIESVILVPYGATRIRLTVFPLL